MDTTDLLNILDSKTKHFGEIMSLHPPCCPDSYGLFYFILGLCSHCFHHCFSPFHDMISHRVEMVMQGGEAPQSLRQSFEESIKRFSLHCDK